MGILCAFGQKKQPQREGRNLNVHIIGWRLENEGREGGRRRDWWNQNFPDLEGVVSRLDFIFNAIKMPLESKQGTVVASLRSYSLFKGRSGCFMEYGFGVVGGGGRYRASSSRDFRSWEWGGKRRGESGVTWKQVGGASGRKEL